MKRILTILAILSLAVSCGQGKAQKEEQITENKEIICGGYTEQREPTAEEIAMFKTVAGAQTIVLSPLSVSTQVVAGLNYKFWCRFEDTVQNKSGHCWVVIYKPLKGDPQLSRIEEAE